MKINLATKHQIAYILFLVWFGLPIHTHAVSDSSQAEVEVLVNSTPKGITLSIKRNPECHTFKVECMASEIVKQIPSDEVIVQYFKGNKNKAYSADLIDSSLPDMGIAFMPGTDYTLMVIPYDKEGKAGKVSRATFHVAAQTTKSRIQVETRVMNVGTDSISLKFIPNKHVKGYALCMFPAGEMDKTLEKHGKSMGFTNVAEMIKRFSGSNYQEESHRTWRNLAPDTDYDFCVQTWDNSGAFAQLFKTTLRTAKLGGPGEATVSIEIQEFGGTEAGGFFQYVVYTPNDQAALHRDIIITEEAFNKPDMGDEGVIRMLQQEIPEDPNWNQYGVDKAQWNAEPNTVYIACSIAKNINGEWGPLKKVRFTTPSSPVNAE